ncbi:hypothetical protein DFH08DRAFT_895058 [Mycena albidolilacea]|uniref:Uncharacterized protein n=1 Tax=Mycena albidolilacea TaxID=1033008 RepID=A0AAD7EDR6_9AGAR|nr:hypothetical protein DFH08DRAFT_895058 [Mycena albidolilacea]
MSYLLIAASLSTACFPTLLDYHPPPPPLTHPATAQAAQAAQLTHTSSRTEHPQTGSSRPPRPRPMILIAIAIHLPSVAVSPAPYPHGARSRVIPRANDIYHLVLSSSRSPWLYSIFSPRFLRARPRTWLPVTRHQCTSCPRGAITALFVVCFPVCSVL